MGNLPISHPSGEGASLGPVTWAVTRSWRPLLELMLKVTRLTEGFLYLDFNTDNEFFYMS